MIFIEEIIGRLKAHGTPFYYYDTDVLRRTLSVASTEAAERGFKVHYAVKANFNPVIMKTIAEFGFGADCVSGNEIEHAVNCGFAAAGTVFAGVGKSDHEIETGLKLGIKCFNCESMEELEVINGLAGRMGRNAKPCASILI
jgi:diaminopimelate decarboxylase